MTSAASGDRATATFWVAVVVGTAVAGWGVVLFVDAVEDPARRWSLAAWIVGADVAHDLLVAPVVLVLGWLSTRMRPRRLRVPVQVGLIVSAAIVAVGWLPLIGSAEHAGNPTIQPLDYRTAVAAALGVVWAGIAAWVLIGWLAERRAQP